MNKENQEVAEIQTGDRGREVDHSRGVRYPGWKAWVT